MRGVHKHAFYVFIEISQNQIKYYQILSNFVEFHGNSGFNGFDSGYWSAIFLCTKRCCFTVVIENISNFVKKMSKFIGIPGSTLVIGPRNKKMHNKSVFLQKITIVDLLVWLSILFLSNRCSRLSIDLKPAFIPESTLSRIPLNIRPLIPILEQLFL